MRRRSTDRSAPCWMFASRPTSSKSILRQNPSPASNHGVVLSSSKFAASASPRDEVESAHLVCLPRGHRAGLGIFRSPRGIVGQTAEKDRGGDGSREAAGKTKGRG